MDNEISVLLAAKIIGYNPQALRWEIDKEHLNTTFSLSTQQRHNTTNSALNKIYNRKS